MAGKKTGRTNKPGAGRPTKMTPDIITILTDCFRRGLNDEDACNIANISPTTLYNYCQTHKKFVKEKEYLKNNLKAKAKYKLSEAIEKGDMQTVRWYLSHRYPDEYSEKQIVDNKLSGGLDVKGQFSNLSDDDLKNMLNGNN